ncbi:MAG: right-handed parallel beta-helix repeat-containing protein [Polyangiaceae bacterium]
MSNGKSETDGTEVSVTDAREDVSRRELVVKLLGAVAGGAALQALAGCAAPSGDPQANEDIGEVVEALTGNGTLKYADTATALRGLTGGAVSWVAVMQGYSAAGDGGGGVFFWSTTAKQDDGWFVLNFGSGNSAGWRRVNPGIACANSVTTLRAISGGSTSALAVLTGYTSPGDGGGGLFRWDTTSVADDGGTVFNAGGFGTSSAGWRRVYSGPLNVRWFGAKGDGIQNDGPAINAAISAAAATGAAVLVPAASAGGTYKVTNDAGGNGIVLQSGVKLFGDGRPVLNFTVTNDALLGDRVHNVEINGLQLQGTCVRVIRIQTSSDNIRITGCRISGGVNGAMAAGISLGAVDSVRIEDCDIYDNGNPTGFSGGYVGQDIFVDPGGGTRLTIAGNRITQLNTTMGIHLANCSQTRVSGNLVLGANRLGSGEDADSSGYGIVLYLSGGTCANNVVEGNYVTNTAGTGIYIQGSANTIVTGNVLVDTCKQQPETSLVVGAIASNSPSCTITGNNIRTCPQYGIQFQGDDVSITANVIGGITKDAISMRPSTSPGTVQRASIIGNTIDGAAKGIATWPAVSDIADIKHCVISGNTISNVADGIWIRSTSGTPAVSNRIIGNVLKGSSDWGIALQGATYTDVIGNTVDGFPGGILLSATCVGSDVRNNRVLGTSTYFISNSDSTASLSGNRGAGSLIGTGTLAGGQSVVSAAEIRATDTVYNVRVTRTSDPAAGTAGHLAVTATSTGAFTVKSSNSNDSGNFSWEIVH